MKKLTTAILLICILIFAGCGDDIQTAGTADPVAEVSPDAQSEDTYQVVRVVDGDTIIIDMNGIEERIRLIGVDTPESVHPDAGKNVEYGKIASDFTKELLEGKSVSLEYDAQERDRYGRVLAYVYLDGVMFNKTLLEEGHAKVSTYPPNVRYVDDFTALQEQARERGKGVWAYEDFGETYSEPPAPNSSQDAKEIQTSYVGNSNTMKFHRSSCRYVDDIADHNMVRLETRKEAINEGYAPCKVCDP